MDDYYAFPRLACEKQFHRLLPQKLSFEKGDNHFLFMMRLLKDLQRLIKAGLTLIYR